MSWKVEVILVKVIKLFCFLLLTDQLPGLLELKINILFQHVCVYIASSLVTSSFQNRRCCTG